MDLDRAEYAEKLTEALIDRFLEQFELTEDELRWSQIEALEFAAEVFTEVIYDVDDALKADELSGIPELDGNEDEEADDWTATLAARFGLEEEDLQVGEDEDLAEIIRLLLESFESTDGEEVPLTPPPKLADEPCYCRECTKERLSVTDVEPSLADRLEFYKSYQ